MARARKEECFRIPGSENWYYKLWDDTGASRRVSTFTADYRKAEEIRILETEKQRRAAVYGEAAVLTFGEACGFYLQAGKSDRYLAPLHDRWEKTLVKNLTPGVIKQTAIDLYPDCKPSTRIRHVITPAVAVINHCAELGKCPPVRVKRWKVARSLKEAVDRDYIDAMLAAAPVPHLAALILFMYTTGSRITMATSLEWGAHVDLQKGEAVLGRDKNGDPHVVHLVPELVVRLANLPRGARNVKKVFGYSSRYSVYCALRRMAGKAGYKYVPPHQVGRHSFATELLDAGYGVADVMKLGNWKSSKMVLEIYGHSRKQRATVIDDVFGRKPSKEPIGQIKVKSPLKALKGKG